MTQEVLLDINSIDIHGMSNDQKREVERVGLWTWMKNYHPVAVPAKDDKRAQAAVTADHLCGLGSKCLRAEKRRGFPVVGKGAYCSEKCASRARAMAQREQKAKRDAFLAEGGQIMEK